MVLGIIIITSLISILAFSNQSLFNRLCFSPFGIKHGKEGWRFVSYALVHAGWAHLFINMFVLYSFGDAILDTFRYFFDAKAYLYFLLLYLGGTAFSVLFDFRSHRDNPSYSAVGASGAVSAIVFSSILVYPAGKIILFPIPFPLPSVVFGVLYLIYSAYMARRGSDNIGHNAHFWGAIFGVVFTIALRPALAMDFISQIQNLF